MKKTKKALLTAAILTSAINMTSCDSGYHAVYGSPPDMDSSEPSESSSYDPYYDDFQPEYGVPEDYEPVTEEPATTEADEPVTEKFDPEQEELAPVYGPPAYME